LPGANFNVEETFSRPPTVSTSASAILAENVAYANAMKQILKTHWQMLTCSDNRRLVFRRPVDFTRLYILPVICSPFSRNPLIQRHPAAYSLGDYKAYGGARDLIWDVAIKTRCHLIFGSPPVV
jgi:hypothetical protein